jgi:hypothetical protein
MTTTTFSLTWKIRGSDVFQQDWQSECNTLAGAMARWTDFWGVTLADCEAFSFSECDSPIAFEISYKPVLPPRGEAE